MSENKIIFIIKILNKYIINFFPWYEKIYKLQHVKVSNPTKRNINREDYNRICSVSL